MTRPGPSFRPKGRPVRDAGIRTPYRTPHRQGQAKFDGIAKQALDTARNRLLMTGALLLIAFTVIGARLVDLTMMRDGHEPRLAQATGVDSLKKERADILDRHGVLLATSLTTSSLYANPRRILDADEAVKKLKSALPGLDGKLTRSRLTSGRSFVWIYRHLTPRQKYAVNRLGIPGLYFQHEESRVYPHGNLAAHVLGFSGIDHHGLAGIERSMNAELRGSSEPLHLTLDIRVQNILHQELSRAKEEYQAIGGTGLVMNAHNGEILALVSLPDFDPNNPEDINDEASFNRATLGVYEMGSTFKIFTAAMALESGTVGLDGGYDATEPIHIGRFTIRDHHPKRRWLTVPEILIYSSNIGAAKMASDVGTASQRAFLGRLGMLSPAAIELPEVGAPLVPSPWRKINTMTVAYGHGLAVSPVQLATGIATIVNGGLFYPATLLPRVPRETGKKERAPETGEPGSRVLSPETSEQIRRLMRLVVVEGTGKKAAVNGYLVGGKTGTAEKSARGGYSAKALLSSFVSAFPMTAPRYVLFVMFDEPKGTEKTFGYATGGWVAAPVVRRVIARTAPILGIQPVDESDPEIQGEMMVNITPRGPRLASF